MRAILIAAALVAALPLLSACQSSDGAGNSAAAMEAMINQPNACGPGGTSDVDYCSSGR